MSAGQSARRFFFLLLAAALVLFALIARPLASALFLAAALAGVLWPAHRRLTRWLGGRRSLSAATFVLGVIVLLLGPTVAFSAFAIGEVSKGVSFVTNTLHNEGIEGLVERLPDWLEEPAGRLVEKVPSSSAELSKSVVREVRTRGGDAAAAVGATLSVAGQFVFQAAMMLIALYFLLLQGDELVAWLDRLSPLKPGQTAELLAEFKRVSYAVILSTLITAGVQAVAALIGYLFAKVPHPIFFTGVTFFVAFIPAVGAGTACLAVALLSLLTGHPYAALFLAIWALTIVSLVDNLIKPLLIKVGMQMNGAVVFFSLIGGLAAFGGVGLLLGPLVTALLLALLRIYQRDFEPKRREA